MKYKGYFNVINKKPKDDEWIEIFAGDWFRDHWAFYAFISRKNYELDINKILDLIKELNWRDGDVYVELINHSPKLRGLYMKLYELGYDTDWSALRVENWNKLLDCSEDEDEDEDEDWAYPELPDTSHYYDQ